ncbi:Cold-inducible protein YdjO [Pelagirhabdus alkalitolerans]|uniref:Cold-inducible protein YdjO n=1 Tax=Pelagirhabdus alkalitolerans TaxID=1612202 RepID=A0A1G6L2Y3_9BACI|nr:cold-shock protein [Pelagirhabdus alkalitolerans]SDC37481.1 Cold-inducible protein YdjO [Pelagirhabdus alkalitolerans]
MAYYNNKREPVEEVETKIWSCTSETCAGWMRVDYSFEKEPTCPLCHEPMIEETKTLPKLS